MKQQIYIHWFRQDLRFSDNPALTFAANRSREENIPLMALYIHDTNKGAASSVWLHHSLNSLNEQLGGYLHIYEGDAKEIINDSLMQHFRIKGIFWNRCYEPWHIKSDALIEVDFNKKGIETKTFNASLLWEPEEVLKKDGTPYKIFTPFYRNTFPPKQALSKPGKINLLPLNAAPVIKEIPGWGNEVISHWHPGEKGAQARLKDFIEEGLRGYKEGRDYPARNNVSRLSAHLHFGEISPGQIWHALEELGDDTNPDLETFRKELAWREFSYSLLYHNPDLPDKNLQSKFDKFPWQNNNKHLKAWQQGKTGYPIIDAGMRELWQTGYMHNRVRMLTGSFLVKNLMLHWKHGFNWFWDTLVDADLANNAASWQWIAGCGADAAPYFRIFNPITQSKKFDPQGTYIKKYIPELAHLPDKYIHEPWAHAKDYPTPIIDLKASRERALAAFKSL